MDLDIDMEEAVQEPLVEDTFRSNADDILQPDEQSEELGEVIDDGEAEPAGDESTILVPSKVHIRGVDTLNTDEIRTYVKSHYGPADRVEWIDDTSANLLFASESIARDALIALSSIDIVDPSALAPGETLVAKPFDGKPEISLRVRLAVQSDRKQPGAALRSRFYLLNPEYDPEERRRRNKYRERDGDRRRSERHGRRDSDGGGGGGGVRFEASMYDDVPRSARERRHSESPERLPSFAEQNRGKELFAGRRSRTRDRSASPAKDLDGDESMGDDRASSSGNRIKARSLKDRITTDSRNRSKELFPTKKSSGHGGQLDQLESAIGSAHLREEDRPKVVDVPSEPRDTGFNIRGVARQGGQGEGFSIRGAASAKELFPSKLGGSNAGKELLGGRAKRNPRQRAEDLFG
ncbi:hypothetical protein ACRE_059810 [Hapsidospora chrysogenum ATCC 11550]|uniref:Uncharacterized protein n=1 Tax=Hapsidospora chrysogenum (strain ATCC 11550 / CBS 779.69 / DSM 880 / IAM 14645 / JCM 23072 / IMI 49137) TaxID=857340 RepID=A0A086T1M0_HAPC1|nr:hypothetical protein ACRE_059810 [Hapsidospora chrysogenum ATCC 11550]